MEPVGQRSTTGTNNVRTNRSREDKVAYLSMQLPLLGEPQSQGFGMGGELNGAARDVSATRHARTPVASA